MSKTTTVKAAMLLINCRAAQPNRFQRLEERRTTERSYETLERHAASTLQAIPALSRSPNVE
jgi:hypothetical protein